MSSHNPKDLGAHLTAVSGGGARGVAGGTGDATEALGAIVDSYDEKGLTSGAIVVCGQATLGAGEDIGIVDLKIEHGAAANLSDAADYLARSTKTTHAAVATSVGGGTVAFAIKQKVNFQAIKRYWRVSATPTHSAGSTDTFELGFCVIAEGEEAPLD